MSALQRYRRMPLRSGGFHRRAGVIGLLAAAAASQLLVASGASAAGKPSKVASIVEQVAADLDRGRSPAALSNRVIKSRADGSVEVNVWARGQVGRRERAELVRLGAKIVATATGPGRRGQPSFGVFHAAVPHDGIDDVAANDWVAAVTTPDYGLLDDHPNNTTNSQGVALHNADDVQARGINGAGVNVGVISNGVPSLAAVRPAERDGQQRRLRGRFPAVRRGHRDARDRPRHGARRRAVLRRRRRRRRRRPRRQRRTGSRRGRRGRDHRGHRVRRRARVPVRDGGLQRRRGRRGRRHDASSAGNLGAAARRAHAAHGTGQGPDGGTGPCAGSEPDNAVAIAGGTDNTFDFSVAGRRAGLGDASVERAARDRPDRGSGRLHRPRPVRDQRCGHDLRRAEQRRAGPRRRGHARAGRPASRRAPTSWSWTSRTLRPASPCRRSTCACAERRRSTPPRVRAA